MHRY